MIICKLKPIGGEHIMNDESISDLASNQIVHENYNVDSNRMYLMSMQCTKYCRFAHFSKFEFLEDSPWEHITATVPTSTDNYTESCAPHTTRKSTNYVGHKDGKLDRKMCVELKYVKL